MRHFPLPVWAAKTTRLSWPPATSALSSTVPVAPGSGACRVIVGLAVGWASPPAALRTTADRAGTVTVTFLSAPDFAVASVPYRPRKVMPAEPVAKVALFSVPALLKATTYSVPVFASVREKA